MWSLENSHITHFCRVLVRGPGFPQIAKNQLTSSCQKLLGLKVVSPTSSCARRIRGWTGSGFGKWSPDWNRYCQSSTLKTRILSCNFLRYIWWHHLYSQSWMVLDLIKSINTHCGTDILVCDSSCQKSFQFFSSEISISSATLLTILNSFLQILFSLNLWFCQKGKPCPHSLTHFHFLASWKQGLTFFLAAFSRHNFD